MKEQEQIIRVCRALSDPTRLEALLALDGGEMCLGELAERLRLAVSTASKHVRILQDAGLVESRKQGRWRYLRHAQPEIPGCAQYAVAWVRRFARGTDAITWDAIEQAQAASPPQPKPNVMFLCSGNSCRSQMAEAFLRKYAGHLFHAFSAGLEPRPIDPMTLRVMREVKIDLSRQKAKSILEFVGKMHFTYLIVVCPRAERLCPLLPGVSYRLYWPFPDPVRFKGPESKRLEKFRRVRGQLERKVREWVGEYSTGRSMDGGSFRSRRQTT